MQFPEVFHRSGMITQRLDRFVPLDGRPIWASFCAQVTAALVARGTVNPQEERPIDGPALTERSARQIVRRG